MPSTRLHLQCLFTIFTMSYYYIYNDFFTIIYWIERCKLGITQLLFLWIADLREIYDKLFRKRSKLFLQIAHIKKMYAKLFTNVRDRTYQNEDGNGCNGSELKEQMPIISDSHKITCQGCPKQLNVSQLFSKIQLKLKATTNLPICQFYFQIEVYKMLALTSGPKWNANTMSKKSCCFAIG